MAKAIEMIAFFTNSPDLKVGAIIDYKTFSGL